MVVVAQRMTQKNLGKAAEFVEVVLILSLCLCACQSVVSEKPSPPHSNNTTPCRIALLDDDHHFFKKKLRCVTHVCVFKLQHVLALKQGDFFGEISLLTNKPRQATVK
jgi:CRP-like cAMP-binding protein